MPASFPSSLKSFVTREIGDTIAASHINDLQLEVAAIESDLLNATPTFLSTVTSGINATALSVGTVPLARLASANTTANGIVDTTTQSFAGGKTFSGVMTITGAATLSNTLGVTGATTLSNTLAVTGATTLSSTVATGALTVTGAATVSTTLGVTGATTLSSTVATGALTVTGAATVSTTLGVTGATTLSSTLGVTGLITSTGGITGGASSHTTGAFSSTVTGGTYNGQTISSAASFTGTLATVGAITAGGTIQTLGTLQSSSGADLVLNANGANRDVYIKVNGTTLLSAIGSTGGVTVAGLLTVSGSGTNTFTGAGNAQILNVINTQVGAAGYLLANFTSGSTTLALTTYNQSYTTYGGLSTIEASGALGLGIYAQHASGTIKFYSGGSTVRLTMATTGGLLSQLAAGTAAPGWRFYSDHTTNVELFLGNQAANSRTGVIGWNDTYGYGFLTVYGSANNFRWTASDFTRNGTAYTNPDYVFEHWATGQIVQFADREGAAQYDGLRTLADVEALARTTYALPRIADWRAGKAGGNGIFGGGDACLASIEEAYLYLFQHDAIISQLAARIAALETKDH